MRHLISLSLRNLFRKPNCPSPSPTFVVGPVRRASVANYYYYSTNNKNGFKLNKCDANYAALSPITFLKRAAMVYADRTSIIYGDTVRFTWQETYDRCRRLASALQMLGVVKDDVVSVLAPNIPALYEMHFGVPMAGAVLNTINIRLDAKTVKTILSHSEAKVLFVDYEFIPLAYEAIQLLKANPSPSTTVLPLIVLIHDEISHSTNKVMGEYYTQLNHKFEYEELIEMGSLDFVPSKIDDEWDSIALNYTSGTTSSPKGVVYSHRGAYLSTLSMILGWEMGTEPVYLWSLPMFHCNGWTFTWGVAARGGTNVFIRRTNAYQIYRSIELYNVTHMCCAPVVLSMLRQGKDDVQKSIIIKSLVRILVGGAPPPTILLEEMERLGFRLVHAYGLTEATGPALLCEWNTKWDDLGGEEQARLRARQGISVLNMEDVDVKDTNTMKSVPYDGKTTGEIVIRGSGIMKGYFKDEKATLEAFRNGWFHTGDVGVVHSDGYIEIKDRLKDVIISGGENISSVEVEGVMFRHSKVVDVAVVAMPDTRWGESPCAFVVVKEVEDSNNIVEQDVLSHCKSNLPRYMVPKKIVFVKHLPKTSTGKLQKGVLRNIAKTLQTHC